MGGMILDTSFLVDLMRGDEAAVENAQELEENLVQQRLSPMTLFELYYGVAGAMDAVRPRPRRRGPHIETDPFCGCAGHEKSPPHGKAGERGDSHRRR